MKILNYLVRSDFSLLDMIFVSAISMTAVTSVPAALVILVIGPLISVLIERNQSGSSQK